MKLKTTSLFRGFCPVILFATLVMGQASAFGQVQYVCGDFNGDRISDLIIVTASGSFPMNTSDCWAAGSAQTTGSATTYICLPRFSESDSINREPGGTGSARLGAGLRTR